MFDTTHPQQRMPAVRCLPDISVRESVQIKRYGRAERRRQRLPQGNYRRQNLRRPKHGLFLKGPLRVSRERVDKPTGKPFTVSIVRWIRFKHRIPGPSLPLPARARAEPSAIST
jgi:hypothetical protein